jgi:hypothetical protein
LASVWPTSPEPRTPNRLGVDDTAMILSWPSL